MSLLSRYGALKRALKSPKLIALFFSHIESTPTGILYVNKKSGKIFFANSAFLKWMGYSLNELTQKPFIEYVHKEDVIKTLKAAGRLEKTDSILTAFQNRWMTKTNQVLFLRWQARTDNGYYICTVEKLNETAEHDAIYSN